MGNNIEWGPGRLYFDGTPIADVKAVTEITDLTNECGTDIFFSNSHEATFSGTAYFNFNFRTKVKLFGLWYAVKSEIADSFNILRRRRKNR